jgi:Eco29kI restriction endonuclease
MKEEPPFNPLDKLNLGLTVRDALLKRPILSLPPKRFKGAGIYAFYSLDSFEPYRKLAKANRERNWAIPIYVGEAVPLGSRKGGYGLGEDPGDVLWRRLQEHSKSIEQAKNLKLEDFRCRYLVVEDIWIPLGENLLIEMFNPLWNRLLDGFGNHDPGKGRYNQMRSPWDVVHPGRLWADKCALNPKTAEKYIREIKTYIDQTYPNI